MLLILTAALTMTLNPSLQEGEAAPTVSVAEPRSTASQTTHAAGMVIARGPTLTGETKTVCRRERPMDSNIPQRICRVVPVNSSQRARVNDDHVRELQRLPGSAENMPSRSPGGRSVF